MPFTIGIGDYVLNPNQNSGQFNADNIAQPACFDYPQIIDDNFVEENEDFTVELTGGDDATVSDSSASLTVTIVDNDGMQCMT